MSEVGVVFALNAATSAGTGALVHHRICSGINHVSVLTSGISHDGVISRSMISGCAQLAATVMLTSHVCLRDCRIVRRRQKHATCKEYGRVAVAYGYGTNLRQ